MLGGFGNQPLINLSTHLGIISLGCLELGPDQVLFLLSSERDAACRLAFPMHHGVVTSPKIFGSAFSSLYCLILMVGAPVFPTKLGCYYCLSHMGLQRQKQKASTSILLVCFSLYEGYA